MNYKIFPPIGIARVGDSDEFFVGPEWPGGLGVEIAPDGTESDVTSFKDATFRVKRQVARFRIFEFEDNASPGRPAQLPEGTRIKWTVHLANKKAAIDRPSRPPEPARIMSILATSVADKVLDGGKRTISGANAIPVPFVATLGTSALHPDYLGELRTDRHQNLLAFGGRGKSTGERVKLITWYTNETWFDDVSDGPVTAEIVFPDGTSRTDVDPAWVIVAPPDFVPAMPCIVTLYDVLSQSGHEHFGLPTPAQPTFTEHIYPLLKRSTDLHWVNGRTHWRKISTDYVALSNSSTVAQTLRAETAQLVREIEQEEVLQNFVLPAFQHDLLDRWVNGDVQDDWVGVPTINRAISPEALTRAALDGGVGSAFHPGIEAGDIVLLKEIYATPFAFRLSHDVLDAGDMTALMAQPWQADFWACSGRWWPSQRPDIIRFSANRNDFELWEDSVPDYGSMVDHANHLGMVLPKTDDQGRIVGMREEGRDHAQVPHPDRTRALAPFTTRSSQQRRKLSRRRRAA